MDYLGLQIIPKKELTGPAPGGFSLALIILIISDHATNSFQTLKEASSWKHSGPPVVQTCPFWLSHPLPSVNLVSRGTSTAQSIQKHQWAAVRLCGLSPSEILRSTALQDTKDRSSKAQKAGFTRGGIPHVKTLSVSNSTFHIRRAVC